MARYELPDVNVTPTAQQQQLTQHPAWSLRNVIFVYACAWIGLDIQLWMPCVIIVTKLVIIQGHANNHVLFNRRDSHQSPESAFLIQKCKILVIKDNLHRGVRIYLEIKFLEHFSDMFYSDRGREGGDDSHLSVSEE